MTTLKGNDPDQFESIVRQFIRDVHFTLSQNENLFQNVPTSIKELIASYAKTLFSNQGTYSWSISDPIIVEKMLNAETGDKFTSTPFTIARVKCQIEVYPNGDKQELSGYFVIYLRILSLPKYVKNITVGRIFHVLENRAGASFHNTISQVNHDWWGRKCPLSELIELNPNTITVQIEIIINKICINADGIDILNNYPLKPISTSFMDQFKMKRHLEFKLNKFEMKMVKKCEVVKAMSTNIMYDLWTIQLYPCDTVPAEIQNFTAFFEMLRWPKGIKQMKVKYEFWIDKIDDETMKSEAVFREDKSYYGIEWANIKDLLAEHDQATVMFDVQVVEMTPKITVSANDIFEIYDPIKIAYLLSAL